MKTTGLLSASGNDAKKLLQGQFTCDLEAVSATEPSLGAHCNPQGRVISLFLIQAKSDGYWLAMPKELAPIALKALQKYAIFFKVKIEDLSDTKGLSEDSPIWQTDFSKGIPGIYPETSGKFLPHELNLPQLNAVSFTKGCYTGQEIIARMEYRGKLKSRLFHARVSTQQPIMRGQDIYRENTPCGNVVDFNSIGYNNYELLVIAPETAKEMSSLFVDPEQTGKIEF